MPAPGASGGRVPQHVRERVDNGFEGFIGNPDAVASLRRELLRALLESPPHLPKNILFTGSPSTGKTELARRVSRILDLPFVRIDGRNVQNPDRLIELLDGVLEAEGQRAVHEGLDSGLPAYNYPPAIVFVDEVHLVPRGVQDHLLTMLERSDRRGVLRNRVVWMNRVTFLFATTRASELDRAFRTRCTEIGLLDYSINEVAQMIGVQHNLWPEAVRTSLALHGRIVPRIALELADSLVAEVEVSDRPERSLEEHLNAVLQSRGILDLGLTRADIDYLAELERQRRPVGSDSIKSLLHAIDPARIDEEVEPYLVRQGLIRLTRAGREITAEGREYLGRWRATS